MKRSNSEDDPLPSMNPPKRARITSPQRTKTSPTIPNTPSNTSLNKDPASPARVLARDHAHASELALARAPHVPAPSLPVLRGNKIETIDPPFPWAKNRRPMVHDLNYFLENKIEFIKGKLQCKICKYEYDKDVNLRNTIKDVSEFIKKKEASMHALALEVWMKLEFKRYHLCRREDGIFEPLIGSTKKREINWLFLFLTQSLGCCDLGQLKYFLKHNKITIFHSEDKQRIFYATYMALYKQIVPNE